MAEDRAEVILALACHGELAALTGTVTVGDSVILRQEISCRAVVPPGRLLRRNKRPSGAVPYRATCRGRHLPRDSARASGSCEIGYLACTPV